MGHFAPKSKHRWLELGGPILQNQPTTVNSSADQALTVRCYLVGGAVRDRLLHMGLHSDTAGSASLQTTEQRHVDRDWVVVGSTPEAMLQAGFRPVGKDFPVFLHPETGEEFALARTERKTTAGYHGFDVHAHPSVTLEQDLERRDLTLNAMAVAAPVHDPLLAGRLNDWPWSEADVLAPHGGLQDLKNGVLRHVGPAFVEDPVRVLRLARLAARFDAFTVAPATLKFMQTMVQNGEVSALVPERVWQEVSRGLMEHAPARMFEVLRECGALQVLAPEVDRLWGVPQRADYHPEVDTGVHVMMVLNQSARMGVALPVRYACLCHDLGKGTTPDHVLPRHLGHETRGLPWVRALSERWKVPTECRDLALLVCAEHGNVAQSAGFGAEALWRLMDRCDAWRRPDRFEHMLQACDCDTRGRLHHENDVSVATTRLRQALQAALSVKARDLLAQDASLAEQPSRMQAALATARTQAIAQSLNIE